MSLWENASGQPIESGGVPVECEQCPCDACVCDISWTFTDEGFIDGAQDGALREYADPGSVTASPWTLIGTCGLRLDFEDSDDVPPAYSGLKPPTTGPGCANHNPYTQRATATGSFTLASSGQISVTWTGQGEQQDEEYEQMSLYIDGVLLSRAHAPGGDLGCTAPASVVSEPDASLNCFPLSSGVHSIEVRASTNDQFYHVGAFYRFILHCGSDCSIPSCCIDPEETAPTAVIVATPGVDECEWTFTSASVAGTCGGSNPESCLWLYTITTQLGAEIAGSVEDADCSGFTLNILDILCAARASGVEGDCPLGTPGDLVDINCGCGVHDLSVTLVYTDPSGCTDKDTQEYTCGCEITEVPTLASIEDGDPADCTDCAPDCCKDVLITYPETDSCGHALCLMHNLPGGPGIADDCPCEASPCVDGTGSGTKTLRVEGVCVEDGTLDFSMHLIRSGTCCTGPTVVVSESVSCGCECCNGNASGALMSASGIVNQSGSCDCTVLNVTDIDVQPQPGNTCIGDAVTTIIPVTCGVDVGDGSIELSWTVECTEGTGYPDPGYWLRLFFNADDPFSTGGSGEDFIFLSLSKPDCASISECIEIDGGASAHCDYSAVTVCAEFYA